MPVENWAEEDSTATVASLKQYLWSIIYMPSSLRFVYAGVPYLLLDFHNFAVTGLVNLYIVYLAGGCTYLIILNNDIACLDC